MSRIKWIEADRRQALSTQHFLVRCVLQVSVPKEKSSNGLERFELQSLHNRDVAKAFSTKVISEFQDLHQDYTDQSSETYHKDLQQAFRTAASNLLCTSKARPRKPWISDTTLLLIDKRNLARYEGRWTQEKELSKIIQRAVKKNRELWLQSLTESGSWADIKKLRKPLRPA